MITHVEFGSFVYVVTKYPLYGWKAEDVLRFNERGEKFVQSVARVDMEPGGVTIRYWEGGSRFLFIDEIEVFFGYGEVEIENFCTLEVC